MTLFLLVAAPAFAHGGEDHAEPTLSRAAPAADSAAAVGASRSLEAVLRVPRKIGGPAAEATLLLADWATSAPIDGAAAAVTLSGPATVEGQLGDAGAPGVYHGALAFPSWGTYAGALVVTSPRPAAEGAEAEDRVELISISGLDLSPPEAAAHDAGVGSKGLRAWLLAGALLLAGVALGWGLGRGRGATTAAVLGMLGLGFSSREVAAHGGEDHGEASRAPAAPSGSTLTMPLDSQFLVGLRTVVLHRDSFRDHAPAVGRFVARPGEAATLGAPVDGVVLAPPGGFPNPGQRVRAGDTLALLRELPGTADRAALAQERGDAATRVAEATAALALAERDAAALDTLGESVSARDRVARLGAVQVARVALREAESALAALAGGVTVPIRAPVDGRLGRVGARPGDQVEAGTTLFRVVDAEGLWLEAGVPERYALGLVAGAPAKVLPSAAPGRELAAVVLDPGQEADPATGMVTVTLAVEAGDLGLRPGMGATAWLGRGSARDALVLPAAALVDSNGTRLAFVKTGPETFEARELRIGGRSGASLEILGGLSPGERVVLDGTASLRRQAGR